MLVSVWACLWAFLRQFCSLEKKVLTEKAKDKNAKGLHYRINEILVFEVVFLLGWEGGRSQPRFLVQKSRVAMIKFIYLFQTIKPSG
jgi:hypothetical protein